MLDSGFGLDWTQVHSAITHTHTKKKTKLVLVYFGL